MWVENVNYKANKMYKQVCTEFFHLKFFLSYQLSKLYFWVFSFHFFFGGGIQKHFVSECIQNLHMQNKTNNVCFKINQLHPSVTAIFELLIPIPRQLPGGCVHAFYNIL